MRHQVMLYFPLLWAWFSLSPVYAFDLTQAWQAAKTYSADYAAAQYGRDAEAEQKHQARAALLPQISANALYQKQPASLSSNTQSHGWNIQANQVLFDKSRWAQYQQGKLAEQIADVKLINSETELLVKVAQAYFEVLLQQDKLLAIRDEKTAYEQQLKQAIALFHKGAATIVDTHEAQAGYDAALAKEIATHNQLIIARNHLTDLTGLDVQSIRALKSGLPNDLLNNRLESYWQDLAQQHNSEWQLQKFNHQQTVEGIKAAQGNRLPKLNLSGGYQNYHNTQQYGRNEQHYRSKGGTLTLQLTVPLYSGGQINSQVREALAKERQQQELLIATERKVKLAVKQAYRTIIGNRYQILAQQRLLETNRAKLASTKLGRTVGVRTHLELIQAQQAKAEAEQKLAEAKYSYLVAYIQLLHHVGVLVEPKQQQELLSLFDKN